MITKEQKDLLVDKVNEKVNLPILGERAERIIFEKAIEKIIKKIERELPDEVLDYLNDVNQGFTSDNEVALQEAIRSTVDFLNKKINLPLMNEKTEQEIFTTVIEMLFYAMKKGNKLAA